MFYCIYDVKINGNNTNFKLYVGVEEENQDNNKDDVDNNDNNDNDNNNETKTFITEDNNGNFYKLLSKTLCLIYFILF